MAPASCGRLNNILVSDSGNESLGATAGVKRCFYMCQYFHWVRLCEG